MPDLVAGPITVRSPATSANLGPGFDSLGLALGLWDEYTARPIGEREIRVHSRGEGAAELPRDRTHLVARAVLAGLATAGISSVPGLAIDCLNRIPHRRGLGSSSAAIVGGLRLAHELLGGDSPLADPDRLVAEAAAIEGHPDNVAAAALGGFTIAWTDEGVGRAVSLSPHPSLRAVVFIPAHEASTETVRGLLPGHVPMADAVFNLGRSALVVQALTTDPALLLSATADRLHQGYRRDAYPQSLALVEQLRADGIPAAISGAGPTVIALTDDAALAARLATQQFAGFTPMAPKLVDSLA